MRWWALGVPCNWYITNFYPQINNHYMLTNLNLNKTKPKDIPFKVKSVLVQLSPPTLKWCTTASRPLWIGKATDSSFECFTMVYLSSDSCFSFHGYNYLEFRSRWSFSHIVKRSVVESCYNTMSVLFPSLHLITTAFSHLTSSQGEGWVQ